MERISVNDRVQIIKVTASEQNLLNKTGKVMLIADDVTCLVVLDGGNTASVNVNQLKKVQ